MAAVLEVFGEDIGGVHEEVGPKVVRGLVGKRGEELLELLLRVAPGEVGVALLEPRHCKPLERSGAGERLGQEDDIRALGVHLADQPLPELERLGVRVVDAEDADALRNPVAHDPQHLGADSLGIVVEVDRIDVLILLRGVLGVRDGPVGERREPLRVACHPRMIRGRLQREVERNLEPFGGSCPHERTEVGESAEIRMDGIMSALCRADRPRRARIARTGGQRVVRTLAIRAPDRMDRRQVHDVETHPCNRGKPLAGSAKRTALDGAVFAEFCPFGPGEELVPGAHACPFAFDEQVAVAAHGHEGLQRASRERCLQTRIVNKAERLGAGIRAELLCHLGEHAALGCRSIAFGSAAFAQQRPHLQHEGDIDTGEHFDVGRVVPGGEVVSEGLEVERPGSLLKERNVRPPAVESVPRRVQAMQRLVARR